MSPISRGPAPRLVFLSWHINKVSIYLSISKNARFAASKNVLVYNHFPLWVAIQLACRFRAAATSTLNDWFSERRWFRNKLHSRSNRKRGRVKHLHVQTAFMTVIFKTAELIRLSRILSYTNHESGKFQSFYVQLRNNNSQYEPGWLALPRWLLSRTTGKGPARSLHF